MKYTPNMKLEIRTPGPNGRRGEVADVIDAMRLNRWFCVHNRGAFMTRPWVVTHVPSTLAAGHCPGLRTAKNLAGALGVLGLEHPGLWRFSSRRGFERKPKELRERVAALVRAAKVQR